MAKLFKTLSLVDRFALSEHSTALNLPKANNQQAGSLKLPVPIQPIELQTTKLKETPNTKKLALIANKKFLSKKLTLTSPQEANTKFTTPPISTFVLPKLTSTAKLNIYESMSLKDRLKQTSTTKSTKHLGQYFLSDTHTGFSITKPFGVYDHTAAFALPNGFWRKPEFTIKQVKKGITILPYKFDSLLRQGTVLSNGVYTTVAQIRPINSQILIKQGVIFNNGQFTSVAVLGFGSSNREIAIKQGTANAQQSLTQITRPTQVVLQGTSGNIPTAVLPTVNRLLQGLVDNKSGKIVSFVSIKPTNDLPQTQAPNIELINFSTIIVDQGSTTLQNINFNDIKINQKVNPIRIQEYQANRAKSILLPRVFHGSAIIPVKDFTSVFISQGQSNTLTELFLGRYTTAKSVEVNNLMSNQLDAGAAQSLLTNAITQFQYFRAGSKLNNSATLNKPSLKQSPRATTRPPSGGRGQLGITPDKTGLDFINLKINGIQFKALITSFSDNWSPSWTDQNYVGRQDTLKVFKGVTRNVSLGFKVVAWSTVSEMYTRLENLVKSTVVGKPTGLGYVDAPLTKLTIGGIFINVACVCTSLKIDFNPSEYSWDIDKKLPMLADVSIDFAILKSNNGQMLHAGTNTYFG